jgi:hypothetical protein
MCLCFYLLFAGLILLYKVAEDFHRRQTASEFQTNSKPCRAINIVAIRVVIGVFRCVVLCILISICMKLQSAYLKSTGTDIASWFWSDALSFLNRGSDMPPVESYDTPNNFSSLIVVLASTFTFLYAGWRLASGSRLKASSWLMVSAMSVLVASYMLIGVFVGFSILLSGAVLFAIFTFLYPLFPHGRIDLQGHQKNVSWLA